MSEKTQPRSPDPDDDDGSSNRGALIGLAVIVVLGLIGWFVVRGMQHKSALEDCMLAGRHDCEQLEGTSR